MKESDIQSDIMKMLGTHPDVAWAYVTSTGTFKGLKGGRPIKIGFTGLSDIIGQMVDGRLLAIEVKVPGKKPTKEQVIFLSKVRRNGGIGMWLDSAHAVNEIIAIHGLVDAAHKGG